MHTFNMVIAGLLLLAIFHFGRRFFGAGPTQPARHIPIFLIFWLVIAVGNMLIGMVFAGYSFGAEIAILLVTYGLPAAAAVALQQRLTRRD